MDHFDPHLLAQARFKNKLSNQLLISTLTNEEFKQNDGKARGKE